MELVIHEDISLRNLNSFGVDAHAQNLIHIDAVAEMQEATALAVHPKMILGAGSNVLFTEIYRGLVLHNRIEGIEIAEEGSDWVKVQVGGGVNWHAFVQWAIQRGFGGVQNLSLIPGTVGAAPIQNIGAYGVEFDSVFDSLEAVDLATGEMRIFDKKACAFDYRSSIFKTELKGRFAVVYVTLLLTKRDHKLVLDYGAIRSELDQRGIARPTIAQIGEVVVDIRQSKLPDPKQIGNAGSFFKNPIIPRAQFEELRMQYPDMVSYPLDEHCVKVPAAWLIEHCGWRGYRDGEVGIYKHHALVLVNYGNGTGSDLYNLALRVQQSVKEVFDIGIIPEVNIL